MHYNFNCNRSSRIARPGFSLFECYRQKIGLIFSKHDSVLVFLMGQNPKCWGYNQRLFISKISDIIKERTKETSYNISSTRSPIPSPVLANVHSLLAYDVSRAEDVGLLTKFRFNVGPASQPIAGSMPVNTTNPSLGLLYTLINTWHSPNAVSMLTHSLRRWHWNSIGWLYYVFWLLYAGDYAGDAFNPGARNTR